MASRERDVLNTSDEKPDATRLVVEGSAERVDRFLARVLPGSSRKHAQTLCALGLVRRGGRLLRKSEMVAPGDVLEVVLAEVRAPTRNDSLELKILLERPDVVVVDKPAGIPTAAVGTRVVGTLAGALLARYPEMGAVGFGVREPGLLHRLDTFTSGAIAAARTPEAFERLRAAMANGELEKRYLAIAPCLPEEEGVFESGLRPERGSRRVVVDPAARLRRTAYRRIARGRALGLYEVSVGLAYRHQIRVHFATERAPLLGDALYGGRPWLSTERHALHAWSLTLAPSGAQRTGTGRSSFIWRAVADVPEDFVEVLRADGVESEDLRRAITP